MLALETKDILCVQHCRKYLPSPSNSIRVNISTALYHFVQQAHRTTIAKIVTKTLKITYEYFCNLKIASMLFELSFA